MVGNKRRRSISASAPKKIRDIDAVETVDGLRDDVDKDKKNNTCKGASLEAKGAEDGAKGVDMLKRLEDSIKELVRRYEAASEENRKLKEGLSMRELEIKGLRKKLEQLNNERAQVRKRVDELINHVEGLVSGT